MTRHVIFVVLDAKNFYYLEDWVLDPYNPQYTGLLKRYYDYHKSCARSAFKIASMSAISDEIGEQRQQVSAHHVDKIKSSFLESAYAFLDGLVPLAFSDYKPLNEREEFLLAKKRENIDVHSMVWYIW